jgi:hypothetical protein
MKFLSLFEDFKMGKFRLEDIERAWKEKRPIFTSIVKDNKNHKFETPLYVVDIDDKTGEITVSDDTDVYYVDLEDIEKLGNE